MAVVYGTTSTLENDCFELPSHQYNGWYSRPSAGILHRKMIVVTIFV